MCSDDSDVLAASTIFRPRDPIRRLDAIGPRISAGSTPVLVTSTIFEAEWLQKILNLRNSRMAAGIAKRHPSRRLRPAMGALLTMPKAEEDYHTRGCNEKRRPGQNGAPLPTSLRSSLSAPKAAEMPASRVAAAGTLAVDHGLARESAHSNGSHVRCARAARCHSPARAAVAVPGYR